MKKISPDIAKLITEKSNSGMQSPEISAWLLAEHAFILSERNIRRFLRNRRAEAADVAKIVVREELRKHVLPCVNYALDLIDRARSAERRARKKGDIHLELRAQDRQRHAIGMVLHHAGLNEPETVKANIGGQNPREQLLSRFNEMIKAAKSEPSKPLN